MAAVRSPLQSLLGTLPRLQGVSNVYALHSVSGKRANYKRHYSLHSRGNIIQRVELSVSRTRSRRALTSGYYCYSSHHMPSTEVGTEELEELLDSNDVQLIDIREPEELTETGQISSSVNIPLGSLEDAFTMSSSDYHSLYGVSKPLLNDKNIVFYCKAGRRSRVAMEIARNLGYAYVRHYYPGMDGWMDDKRKMNKT